MAKTKIDTVLLRAVERGFAMGRLVDPGTTFLFYTHDAKGVERKLPKWAQLADLPLPEKTKQTNGDLKPKDAQKAVGSKRADLEAGNKPADKSTDKPTDKPEGTDLA